MSSRNEPRRPNAGRSGGACTRGEQTHKLVELTRAQCLELLESNDFGRVILTTNSDPTPMIRPVKYRFDSASQSVAFRTGDGAKLFALSHGARASFELDGIDSLTRTGWSVIISGVTDVVTQPLEIQRLDQLQARLLGARRTPELDSDRSQDRHRTTHRPGTNPPVARPGRRRTRILARVRRRRVASRAAVPSSISSELELELVAEMTG